MRSVLRVPLAAVSFLTILPIGRRVAFTGADVARAGVLFPVVGAGIGAIGGAVVWWVGLAAGPLVAAVLGVAVMAALTGALHLDGLADSADSFGGRTRPDALRIMRDHQIGTYGAVALILDLALKIAAVAPVAGSAHAVAAMAAAGAVSRAAGLVLAAILPYAQPVAGTGAVLSRSGSGRAVAGVAVAALICVLAVGPRAGWPLGAAGVVTALVGVLARRRLGGITGDVLGAAAELVETAALVVVVAAL